MTRNSSIQTCLLMYTTQQNGIKFEACCLALSQGEFYLLIYLTFFLILFLLAHAVC